MGAGAANAATPRASKKLTTITLGAVPFYANAALALGEKDGIFAHYGIKVNLQTAANVNVTIAALHSGQYQAGFASLPLVLNADETGQGVKCIAPLGPENQANAAFPENAVMVAPGSSIKSLADLDGQTVGMNQLAGSNQFYLEVAVANAGGNFSTIKLATIPFADMAAAIKSGTIQAGFEVPPYISAGQAAGDQTMLADLDNVTAPWTDECYIATSSYITAHPSVVKDFVEAEDQSILLAAAHPKLALAEVPTVSGLTAAAVKTAIPPKIAYSDNLDPASMIDYQNLMIKYQALNGSALTQGQIAYVPKGTPMTKLLFNSSGKYTGGS